MPMEVAGIKAMWTKKMHRKKVLVYNRKNPLTQ
jgi:hypothetical protein